MIFVHISFVDLPLTRIMHDGSRLAMIGPATAEQMSERARFFALGSPSERGNAGPFQLNGEAMRK